MKENYEKDKSLIILKGLKYFEFYHIYSPTLLFCIIKFNIFN